MSKHRANATHHLGGTMAVLFRICMGPLKINLSQAFAGQKVGVKQVEDKIRLVSFVRYDLGFFDHETPRIESAANPFAAKLTHVSGMKWPVSNRNGPLDLLVAGARFSCFLSGIGCLWHLELVP